VVIDECLTILVRRCFPFSNRYLEELGATDDLLGSRAALALGASRTLGGTSPSVAAAVAAMAAAHAPAPYNPAPAAASASLPAPLRFGALPAAAAGAAPAAAAAGASSYGSAPAAPLAASMAGADVVSMSVAESHVPAAMPVRRPGAYAVASVG
jgi:hypothetical protein